MSVNSHEPNLEEIQKRFVEAITNAQNSKQCLREFASTLLKLGNEVSSSYANAITQALVEIEEIEQYLTSFLEIAESADDDD